MEKEHPVWLGKYVWEETPFDGGPPKSGPLPAEVLSMFRPQHCLLCGITTANMQTAYTHYESIGHFKKVTHHMREKYNALGSLKSKKEKFREVKCDICNVGLSSRIVYLQHYDGKQHAKNMKKHGFKPPAPVLQAPVVQGPPGVVPPGESVPIPAPPSANVGVTKDLPPPSPLSKPGDYVCALCNVTMTTRGQMEVHNNASRHLKNVAKLADGELRDYYMKNGNCEPVNNDETDSAAKDNSVSDQPSVHKHRSSDPQPPKEIPPSEQSQGGYDGGYGPPGPPMDPSMMQQFPPQMPYGPYPQYPTPYDYNSWGQNNMYPGYNNCGSTPYGAGPYGPGSQQYPPYGYPQGPPPEYYNQGQQQYNQGPPQYPQGPQQYNQGSQQYPQGPQQLSQGLQQFNPEQQQHYDYHNSGSHPPNQSNFPGRDQRPNPSIKDPRRHSRNREPFKEPQVNETPAPEGVHLKPLAVLPFIKQIAKDFSDDLPPGVDGPPGLDKPEDPNSTPQTEFPSFNSRVVREEKKITPNDQNEPKCEPPPSLPRTLLDLVRESNKAKHSKEDDEKSKVSDPLDSVSADLPPIPGLDLTPVESKPQIITWSEGNKEEPEPEEDLAVKRDVTRSGGVVPPPPHPLNPPIHFLPPSPESELLATNENSSTKPDPSFSEPQVSSVSSAPSYSQPQVLSENSTPSFSQPAESLVNSKPSQPQQSLGNVQPHYSSSPVPSANPVSEYSQPPVTYPQTYPQTPVNSQYTEVPNYNAPFISNLPLSYSQAPTTNYPSLYPPIPAEKPQTYQQVPSAPPPTPIPQPVLQPPQSIQPTPPPIPPPVPTKQEKDPTVPVPASAQSVTPEPNDDKPSDTTKEDDSKLNASKHKINSFFRRAAEKMFKEAKEKKMKEEAKKIEMDSPKGSETVKKSKDAIVIVPPSSEPKSEEPKGSETVKKFKDAIVVVPPSNGPKSQEPKGSETVKKSKDAIVVVPPSRGPKSEEHTTDAAANLSKVRAHESVSETDNDIGSEPGEIVDKKQKTEKIIDKIDLVGQTSPEAETPKSEKSKFDSGLVGQTSPEAETPKSEKSKFDFGSRKSSENRRKRSFRARRSSVSKSRSRSRSPKRRGRRRSRSWSPSPEKSPVGYYQRNNFRSYYGNDTRFWRNNKAQYNSYQDWNDVGYDDRYARRRDDRDEFGRERKWKEEKKKEERKKKKKKCRKRTRDRSSSGSSPPRKASKERKDANKKPPSPSPPPVAKPERPDPPETVSVDPKPVTVSLMQRLKGVLPPTSEKPVELLPKKDVPAKFVEEVKNKVEVRDVLIRPDVDSDEAREVEKEEQEILKKVALIKKKLLEKEDEKPVKNKKRKKEKSKRRKKRSKSSSSDSDSSDSDSSSSSSSSSTSSSSSSSSGGSEPKSKRIVESLLSKLSRQAATGASAPFDLSMLPALVKKSKKSDGSKKKKKKDKKRKKKKKKDEKSAPPPLQVLSAFITPDGAYNCKCCNLTTSSGTAFLEHLISEKHKLLCKLIATAK